MVLVIIKDAVTRNILTTTMCNDNLNFTEVAKQYSMVGEYCLSNLITVQFYNITESNEELIEEHTLFVEK